MKPKAYSYIRFSSPEQSKGRSYDRQREACDEYCLRNGLELVKDSEYSFFDAGVSAFKADHVALNGQLARFLKLVNDGSISTGSVLIVESLDRLSRERIKHALPRFMDILNRGIDIVTLADGRRYTEDFTEIDLVMSIFIMSRSHEESSIKSKRVGDAWQKKKEEARTNLRPIGNNCPMWLTLENAVYAELPDRVEIVRRIFQMCIDGYGRPAIAKILNGEKTSSFKGKSWGASSIEKIITNRAVLGEYQPHTIVGRQKREPIGQPIPNFFPRIIDDAMFYAAKAATDGRRVSKATNQSVNFNVWQGIAVCQVCGEAMHLVNKGKPPKGAKYLRCYASKKGAGCKARQVRLDYSEVVLKEILTKVDSLALIKGNNGKHRQELDIVMGKLSEKRIQLSEYSNGLEKNYSHTLAALAAECERTISYLDDEQKRINKELAADKIIDKEDFLSRLDLKSYAGRNQANALLKRLKIKIWIKAETPEDSMDTSELEGINGQKQIAYYTVLQDGERQFMTLDLKGKLMHLPFVESQLERLREQTKNTLEDTIFRSLGSVFLKTYGKRN